MDGNIIGNGMFFEKKPLSELPEFVEIKLRNRHCKANFLAYDVFSGVWYTHSVNLEEDTCGGALWRLQNGEWAQVERADKEENEQTLDALSEFAHIHLKGLTKG